MRAFEHARVSLSSVKSSTAALPLRVDYSLAKSRAVEFASERKRGYYGAFVRGRKRRVGALMAAASENLGISVDGERRRGAGGRLCALLQVGDE